MPDLIAGATNGLQPNPGPFVWPDSVTAEFGDSPLFDDRWKGPGN